VSRLLANVVLAQRNAIDRVDEAMRRGFDFQLIEVEMLNRLTIQIGPARRGLPVRQVPLTALLYLKIENGTNYVDTRCKVRNNKQFM
jgi:hypothetical protein